MAHYLVGGGVPDEEGQADLPAGSIIAQLVEEGVCLGLDVLVGLGVEGDLNGALDLEGTWRLEVVLGWHVRQIPRFDMYLSVHPLSPVVEWRGLCVCVCVVRRAKAIGPVLVG